MYLISQQTNQEFITLFFIKKARFPNYSRRVKINFNLSEVLRQAHFFYLSHSVASEPGADPGFFFRRGCTRLLLYFNTNKPHSFFFFFLQITSCIRKPQVISGGGGVPTPCTLPPDPPLELYVKAFQYKILNNILFTNLQLFRTGYTTNDLCSFCKQEPETINHLFCCCPYSFSFRKKFELPLFAFEKTTSSTRIF